MKRYGLRDDQFARIETLLPGRPGTVGRDSELGNRLFVEAVIWKFRSGAPWRDLPERFGDWKNTHKRFSRWAKSGVWENLFKALADDRACRIFCARGLFRSLADEPLAEDDGELRLGLEPFARRSFPVVGGSVQHQI